MASLMTRNVRQPDGAEVRAYPIGAAVVLDVHDVGRGEVVESRLWPFEARVLADQLNRAADEIEPEAGKGWPRDGREAMTALARMFPTLRKADGVAPFDPVRLDRWVNGGPGTSGSRAAVSFLLMVWSGSTHDSTDDVWKSRPFDLAYAWGVWDDNHRAAALAWLRRPFWP
jgi:hypothetical protein